MFDKNYKSHDSLRARPRTILNLRHRPEALIIHRCRPLIALTYTREPTRISVDPKFLKRGQATVFVPALQLAQKLTPLMRYHIGSVVAQRSIKARERTGRKFFPQVGIVSERRERNRSS
jgi:hypothetical protein